MPQNRMLASNYIKNKLIRTQKYENKKMYWKGLAGRPMISKENGSATKNTAAAGMELMLPSCSMSNLNTLHLTKNTDEMIFRFCYYVIIIISKL